MVVLLLTAIYNVLGRLWPDPPESDGSRPTLSALGGAGLIVACGLALFAFSLLVQTIPPPGLAIGMLALLFLVGVERSSVDVAPLALPASAAIVGVLAHVWFQHAALEGQYVGLLAVAHLFAVGYAIVALVRDRMGVDDDAQWILRADVATLVAAGVAYAGLHLTLGRTSFSPPRRPSSSCSASTSRWCCSWRSDAPGRRSSRSRRSRRASSPGRGTCSISRATPARWRSSPRSRSTCCSWRCRSS